MATILVLLTAIDLLAVAVHGQDQTVVDRQVPGPVESVVVENPRGETEVENWSENHVRVLATRAGAPSGSSLSSDLSIARPQPSSLTIAVRPAPDDARVDLRIFVPFNTRVSLASDRTLVRDAGQRVEPVEASTRPRYAGRGRAGGPGTLPDDGPDEGPVELNSMLVNLDVRVSDPAGQSLAELTRKDFEIFENGKRQELVHFWPSSAPMNLVVLLDLSGSTKERVAEIKKAALTFVDSLNTHNNIAVAAFTRKFLLVSPFTTDRNLIRERVMDLKPPASGTAYYDSLWQALELFDEVEGGRRAVVVLTDGVDNTLSNPGEYTTTHTFEQVLDLAVRRETTVFPIYFDTEYEVVVKQNIGTHEGYKTARRQLEQLARETGGVLFRADRAGDLESAYRRVTGELQSIYSIAYESSNPKRDGTWRAIQVTVRRPDTVVKARPGYHAR